MTVSALDISTIGGRQRVHVHVAERPAGSVVVLLAALGIRASYYPAFSERLAAAGIDVLRADYPGHGHSPVRAGRGRDWGYGELVRDHAGALIDAAVARFPRHELALVGHSIGGQIALMAAGASGGRVSAVALLTSGTPCWRAWRLPYGGRVLGAALAVAPLARLLGHYPGDRLGFGGREAATLMRQWARVARTGSFELPGFDGDQLLRRCDQPVLGLRLRGDLWAPESSLRALVARTSCRRLQLDAWRGSSGINHNNWPREPEEPAARVAAWLLSRGRLPA